MTNPEAMQKATSLAKAALAKAMVGLESAVAASAAALAAQAKQIASTLNGGGSFADVAMAVREMDRTAMDIACVTSMGLDAQGVMVYKSVDVPTEKAAAFVVGTVALAKAANPLAGAVMLTGLVKSLEAMQATAMESPAVAFSVMNDRWMMPNANPVETAVEAAIGAGDTGGAPAGNLTAVVKAIEGLEPRNAVPADITKSRRDALQASIASR